MHCIVSDLDRRAANSHTYLELEEVISAGIHDVANLQIKII